MIDNLIMQKIQSYKNVTEGFSMNELKQLPNFSVIVSNNKLYFG